MKKAKFKKGQQVFIFDDRFLTDTSVEKCEITSDPEEQVSQKNYYYRLDIRDPVHSHLFMARSEKDIFESEEEAILSTQQQTLEYIGDISELMSNLSLRLKRYQERLQKIISSK